MLNPRDLTDEHVRPAIARPVKRETETRVTLVAELELYLMLLSGAADCRSRLEQEDWSPDDHDPIKIEIRPVALCENVLWRGPVRDYLGDDLKPRALHLKFGQMLNDALSHKWRGRSYVFVNKQLMREGRRTYCRQLAPLPYCRGWYEALTGQVGKRWPEASPTGAWRPDAQRHVWWRDVAPHAWHPVAGQQARGPKPPWQVRDTVWQRHLESQN